MKVMVVTESRADREILTKYLVEHAHAVQTASDGDAAFAIIDERSCQVAVIDWVTSKRSSIDLIRRLRSRERDEHVYTIVVMSNPTPASVSAAFAAGADDLLRRPFVREELIARVETIERIRRWAIQILGDVASRAGDLSSLKAWKAANRAIGTDLSDFLDRPLEVRPSTRRPCMMAELPLSVAEEGIDCRLRVGVDAESVEALARILLTVDGASSEMLADMVREMANVAGGAMVTAADAEGVALAIGVPTSGDPVRDWSEASGTVQEFALGVTGTPIEFSIRISTHSRERLALASVAA
jgi:DNA-binding response OmpR family regulator